MTYESTMNRGYYPEDMKECVCPNPPIEPLTNMMKETSGIAAEVLCLSHRINSHLFGIGIPLCEKEAEPKCFRDELEKTRCELLATVEELHKICTLLGV